MNKKVLTILLMLYIALLVFVGCKSKQKVKHQWREWGAPTVSETVAFGVHPERGSDSNAVPVYVAPIYYPTGRDDKGKPQFKKIMFELDKLNPENIDFALRELEIINPDALFCDIMTKESDGLEFVGPGADNSVRAKVLITDGMVRYVVDDKHILGSDLVNEEDYEGITDLVRQKGLITNEDVVLAITNTFKENFQFVNCELGAATYEEYLKLHPNAKRETDEENKSETTVKQEADK